MCDHQATDKNLYDYSNIAELKTFRIVLDDGDCFEDSIERIIDKLVKHVGTIKEAKEFIKFAENEKIVIFKRSQTKYVSNNYVWITNYGNIMCLTHEYGELSMHLIQKYNFWLPLDYIEILKEMVINVTDNCGYEIITGENLSEMLEIFQNTVHNKKFMPQSTTESKKHIKEELEREKRDLVKERKELELEKRQLELDRQQLELDKEKLQFRQHTEKS